MTGPVVTTIRAWLSIATDAVRYTVGLIRDWRTRVAGNSEEE